MISPHLNKVIKVKIIGQTNTRITTERLMLKNFLYNSPLLIAVVLVFLGWKVLGDKWSPDSDKAPPPTENWIVTKVSDGDTITVMQTTGQELKIRLCGIDALELAQPLGKESRDALRSLILSSENEVMVSPIEKDRYGRTVAEVFIAVAGGEKFLNEEQLSSGNAFLYKQYALRCPNRMALENAERLAQSKKLRVWSGNYQRPWDYRQQKRNR
jgi:endonuclease YncB( thermonuclease family)